MKEADANADDVIVIEKCSSIGRTELSGFAVKRLVKLSILKIERISRSFEALSGATEIAAVQLKTFAAVARATAPRNGICRCCSGRSGSHKPWCRR